MEFIYLHLVVVSLCWSVVFVSQPYLLGLVLLISSMLVCLIIGVNISSFLGFLLFMSYVGGLMVLFVYVLSVFPNEMYNFKTKTFFMSLSFMGVLVVLVGMLPVKSGFLRGHVAQELQFHFMSFSHYWDVFVFMALFLLFIMLCVSYLVMKKRVPLRSI
uniref:NADH dehydrogenase subunit 6 n=1 Tax=Perna viridis TaxID=73031 RepID=I6QB18_PERVI|nr:NADH dehydrogenase subunit 6 [Perna viridis]AFK75954.1 NADH dehydrogenase subunit 6 [Perna viridis]UJM44264.1 NADH dehydrogenase subunit 6 [Perna viridis]